MSIPRPKIHKHPRIQATDLSFYISDRLRDETVDLYSAFLLAHEALRINRNGYLQPAWNHRLSISELLSIFMHCLTARAFAADAIATVAETWLAHDFPLLAERRRHFLVDRLFQGECLTTDRAFLQTLSEMRDRYDFLPDDDGPYHVEVFPWHFAAPERNLITPGSEPQFSKVDTVDPDVEELIVELCSGYWA